MACNQEVLHSQLVDVHAALNHSTPSDGGWAHMGVGRDDGKQAGGYSPIFYRPSGKVTELENPMAEVVTIGTFAHVHSSPKVAIPCTLFDEGSQSRRESVRLILAAFDALTVSQDLSAVLLAGDLNSPPTDESYQDMMSQESTMEDVCLQVPTEKRHGDERTHTSFGCADSDGARTDLIFSRSRSDRFPSNHPADRDRLPPRLSDLSLTTAGSELPTDRSAAGPVGRTPIQSRARIRQAGDSSRPTARGRASASNTWRRSGFRRAPRPLRPGDPSKGRETAIPLGLLLVPRRDSLQQQGCDASASVEGSSFRRSGSGKRERERERDPGTGAGGVECALVL
ncbi:hypothetical protein B2J93_304 [Marssonina coronariae]|uniref:Endonuclease/exonuclease/phosphatase domain-containing protein n=1 Tax=Diplocarpon coronariae TaxID=2795749 RepID=A0A218YZC4_9HELO|nr:hypothetical protein B2J93_304 [Marssonina coronariae]